MKVAVYRKEHFNAAHQLQVADWSQDENERVFGKCSNPNFHGHNYDLYVKVIGEPDPVTGYLIDLKELSGTAERMVEFRAQIISGLRDRWWAALLVTLLNQALFFLMLVMSLRSSLKECLSSTLMGTSSSSEKTR